MGGAWTVLEGGVAARTPSHAFAIAEGPTDEGGARGLARLISAGQGAAARADAETYDP